MVLKIGSILEVFTIKGYAYAQYTHHCSRNGYLIRVMKGLYDEPQTNLDMLVQKTSLFYTFFALKAALRLKLIKDIGHNPVPDFAQKFPILKHGVISPKTGKVAIWHFWDGRENRWFKKAEELTEEEKNYSLEDIPNFEALKQLIEVQWTPQQDFSEEID